MQPRHDDTGKIVDQIRAKAGSRRVALVAGNFNIVHPGHLRLLNFAAECAQFLVVAVFHNHAVDTFLDEQLRLEAVQSIGIVDYAFILRVPVEEFIEQLKPDVVVKGKEHERRQNPEKSVIDAYGGDLIFASGESVFSSLDLLQRELRETDASTIRKSADFPLRHGFEPADLVSIVGRFTNLKVTVIGDLIVDEYVTCDPLGMSREDPTIVVAPIRYDRFVGGAGIVAAHACGLGASVRYLSVGGDDEALAFARDKLAEYGVEASFVIDSSRPTTLKQRFRAGNKTLLRVSHLRQHDIGQDLADELVARVVGLLDDTDLLMFADFNYGCLPQPLVDCLTKNCDSRGIMMSADSQASSQMSDVSRFKGMRLITPTEHEARLAMRDQASGLVVLAESLRQRSGASNVVVTLASEGILIHADQHGKHSLPTDQLPAFNVLPKDVSGAGDSFLAATSMAIAVGADIWRSSYLGSVAAACQVSRVGNTPLIARELVDELLS